LRPFFFFNSFTFAFSTRQDIPGLHELVEKAIMASSIDVRKTLSRNIYLSGGGTMVAGLAERLTQELQYSLPATCAVKVHTAPYRQHAALQGASVLASLPNFTNLCVWNEDWHEAGPDVLRKWQEDTLAPGDWEYSDDDDDGGGSFSVGRGGGGGAVVYASGSDEDEDDEDDDDFEEGVAVMSRSAVGSVAAGAGAGAGAGAADDDDDEGAEEEDSADDAEGFV
jgi:hypothetical protein